mgnify:CR=1 FL=1
MDETARYFKKDVPLFLTALYQAPAPSNRVMVSSPTHGLLSYSECKKGSALVLGLPPAFPPAPPMHATVPLPGGAMGGDVAAPTTGTFVPRPIGAMPDAYMTLAKARDYWTATPLEAHGARAMTYWRLVPGTVFTRGRAPASAAPATAAAEAASGADMRAQVLGGIAHEVQIASDLVHAAAVDGGGGGGGAARGGGGVLQTIANPARG